MSPLVRSGLRFHLRRPAQLALTVAGVALGVAVVAAMQLAIDSARRAFDRSDEAVFGRVTHVLRGGPAGLDESLWVRLRTAHRELDSAPVVEGRLHLPGHERSLALLGVDPFSEAPFRSQSPAPGGAALARLLTEPGTVLASAGTARRLGLAPGDRIEVLAAGRRRTVTLLGVIEPRNELERAGLDGVLVADIATAQELLDRAGRLDRIDLALPGAGTAAGARALETLRRALPPGVRLEPGAARAGARREMTRAFYLNLRMLSLLALVVGLFVVYNAMTFSVVQRRTLIGTLRAVGVTGREILAKVVAEAALIGVVATAIGLPLGIWLASHLVGLVTRTIDDLYFAAAVREVSLAAGSLLVPAALGVAGSVAAALLPALEATRIPPRAALSASHLEGRARAAVPRLAGLAVCAGVLALVLLAGGGRSLGAAFLALFLLIVVSTALTPAATVGLSHALERGVRLRALRLPFGSVGAMALRGIRAGLSRSSVAVAALAVALATTVGVSVMVESFRASLVRWLDTTLAADVYVSVPGRETRASLAPELLRAAATLPQVRAVGLSRDVEVATEHGEAALKAVSVEGARYRRLQVLDGDEQAAWDALRETAAVLVSEPFAWRHRLARGDRLAVHTDRGERRLEVAGVFRDYGTDRGLLLMGLPAYRSLFADRGVSAIGLVLAPGADAQALRARIERIAGAVRPVRVLDQARIRTASMAVFDRTFAITRVLEWLATLVACVGVLSALMALALERAREMAVLRALGMTRAELLGMLQLQTGAMGLIAGLLSLPLGALMALVLVHVINRRAFGWGMDFHLPPEALLHALLVAVAAAVLAGVYPAWRMAYAPPAAALREP